MIISKRIMEHAVEQERRRTGHQVDSRDWKVGQDADGHWRLVLVGSYRIVCQLIEGDHGMLVPDPVDLPLDWEQLR